jgi:21S rRNA (GM2251-2'-O)-methyltransferase
MIFPSQLGSTLLRTQKLHLPQTFRRYKSITAAIERGRQDGPDRPFRPRTRAPPEDGGDERGRNRSELRSERFGPSSDRRDYTKKYSERPGRDVRSSRSDRDGKPRSSRFGRVGPPGGRDDAPSRFTEDIEERPFKDRGDFQRRREDSFGSSNDRTMSRGNKFDGERKSSLDRFDRRDRPVYQDGDRQPRNERYERGDRPPRREGQFEARGRRPFDRGNKSSDYQHVFFDRKDAPPKREAFGQGENEGRTEHPPRPERSFNRRDESSSYTRDRSGRDQTERYQSREFTRKQPEGSIRATGTGDFQSSTDRGPESLPYSTAASEFIYGYSSVVAAMRANRRKLYTIYVHSRGAGRDSLLTRIRALKLFPITQEVGDEYLRAMDKASSGRPHNGVIMESSPLPVPPLTELKSASIEDESFSVAVDSQTAEDTLINGKQEVYSYKAAGWRHPLILYVDGVVSHSSSLHVSR